MVKIDCNEDGCSGNALYNYKNEKGYKYCKNHLKTRFIDGKTQYMGNKSRKMCSINLCSKNLSKESKTLCSFHYELKLRNLDNIIEINDINDLNKLKKIYKKRLEELNKLTNIEDIQTTFTNNNITKFKLQGLKNITLIEELIEFKETRQEEFKYLNSINIEKLEEIKEKNMEDFKELTGKYKEIIIKEKNTSLQNNPMCIITGCKISANYNIKGAPAIYCSMHAKNKEINKEGIGNLPNQIRNVRTKLCEYIFEDGLDCIKIATCGVGKKQFCPTHMEEGMYKLSKDKKCKEINCNSTPSYGVENGVAEYCTIHKLENMIQLYQKCIIEGCNKRARYNKTGETGSRYCLEHKEDDMLDNYKDKCIEYGCNENADYNIKSIKKGIYCNLHKKDNMCSNKVIICKEENCLVAAYFGTRNDPKQYCSYHKETHMYDFTSKKCSNCGLFEVRRKPDLCSYCNLDRYKKTKEMKVVDFLNKNNIEFIHNKSVGYLCGNFKPDILIDCNTHFIVVEIDEDQHKQYTKECEFARMSNIYLANGLPTIFIRFNPDDFKVCQLRNKTLLNTKLKNLLKLINEYKNKNNINYIELIYMYFDCNCNEKCNYIHIKPFVLE
jgi:hypothetical protein